MKEIRNIKSHDELSENNKNNRKNIKNTQIQNNIFFLNIYKMINITKETWKRNVEVIVDGKLVNW